MADDNQGSRTFLAIVLGGIVLALVVAALFMYGHKGDFGREGRAARDRKTGRDFGSPACGRGSGP